LHTQIVIITKEGIVEENLAKVELWLFEDESNDKKLFTDNNNNKT